MSNQTTETPAEETHDYWVSWYHRAAVHGEFELHSPWWISGYTTDDEGDYSINVMVAAVRATSEDAAWQQIRDAFDNDPGPVEQRFIEPLTRETPFTGRFPQKAWMAWTPDRTCNCDQHDPKVNRT